MASLAQLREDIASLNRELYQVTQEAGPDLDLDKIKSINGDADAKRTWIQEMHAKISKLGAERDRLEVIEVVAQNAEADHKRQNEPLARPPFGGSPNGNGNGRALWTEQKSVGDMLREHKLYPAFKARQTRMLTLDIPVRELKALITLTTITPQAMRQTPVEMAIETRKSVADLCAQGSTERNAIDYYEETTLTNAAAPVAEAAAKPESDIAWTLRTEAVRKIGTFMQATSEVLEDIPYLEGQITNRLRFFVEWQEDAQLLNGSGTAPALRGILQRTGIQTQAKGTDPTPDAIYKAMQKIRGAAGAGFAEPTAVVIHPNDWTLIKLLRDTTGNYLYSGGPATEAGDFIWGLPVRQTTGITAGTGLVGAFRPHAEVVRREGVSVTLSTEHASFFLENKVAILAEERLALAVYRPSAFATVTGINV